MPLLVLVRLCLKLLKGWRSEKISNGLNFWLLYSMSWHRWRNVHRACLLIGNNFPKETLEGHSFSADLSALLSNGDLSYFGNLFLPFNMNPRLQLLEWSREGELVMCPGPHGCMRSSSLPWNTQDIDLFFFYVYKKWLKSGWSWTSN